MRQIKSKLRNRGRSRNGFLPVAIKSKQTICCAVVVLLNLVADLAQSKIVENGIWTGNDVITPDYDYIKSIPYQVINGKVTFGTEEASRRVESGQMTWIGQIDNIYVKENVQLVNSILNEEAFNELFPARNFDIMSPISIGYEHFLTAVALYPSFCGEYQLNAVENLQTLEQACRRELAALFAHITFETGDLNDSELEYELTGLKFLSEEACIHNFKGNEDFCNFSDTSEYGIKFPYEEGKFYFGRGPIHLSWNGKYGAFSKAYHDDQFYGEQEILREPASLLFDPVRAFSSALWYYMTPQYPKPSAHNVIAGFFEPNQLEIGLFGLGQGDFGTTINIMAQDSAEGLTNECWTDDGEETVQATRRADLFNYFTDYLGLAREDPASLGCATKLVTYWGSGDIESFWDFDTDVTCKLVKEVTLWSVYNEEDYKRCVCAKVSPVQPEESCPQEPKPDKCQWTQQEESNHELLVIITEEDQQLALNIYELLKDLQMKFPACQVITNNEEADFYSMQLVKNNQGMTKTDFEFRQEYTNTLDLILESDAPSDMYVATIFNQNSLVFSELIQTQMNSQFQPDEQSGVWKFLVKACVDRRDDLVDGGIDCDDGHNFVDIEFLYCDSTDQNQDARCNSWEPEPKPEPPIIIPEPIPDPNDPLSVDQDINEKDIVDTEDQIDEKDDKDEEELEILDQLPKENSKPFLVAYDSQKIYEVERGSSLQVQLSEYFDQDEDLVFLIAILTEEMHKWIEFDAEKRRFSLRPTDLTPLGLTRASVILDDSKSQIEYEFNFWVNEKQTNATDHTTEPGPKPKPEPIDPKEDSDDIQTKRAKIDIKERVKKIKEQVLIKFPPGKKGKGKKPELMISSINEIGEVQLKFSQAMYLEEVFSDLKLVSTELYEEQEFNNEDGRAPLLRNLVELQESNELDMAFLLKTKIIQGDEETSSPLNRLGYSVRLTEFDDETLFLKLNFDEPLSISIGKKPDSLQVELVEPEIFISKENGKTLVSGIVPSKTIPKQFPSEASYSLAVMAGSTVQAAANTAFLGQFGVTICLAVSLKAMWNLMHVMQVMAYLRLAVDQPANSNMMLQSMHNAITLENIINSIYDKFIDGFDESEDSEEQELLRASDIPYKNMYLSLGIFGIFFAVLIFGVMVYWGLKLLAGRFKFCNTVLTTLGRKLFYSVWIRYMIESNLKTTHNCIFFLYISGGFGNIGDKIQTWALIAILSIIVIWPAFVGIFLAYKRNMLNDPEFKRKFISMYNGTRTQYFPALMYTPVFCLRRLLLVCALLALKGQGVQLIYAYSALSSLYFWYMTHVLPHEETIHNRLEFFNELCLITMQYLMIFFLPGSYLDPQFQWNVGMAVMILVGGVFAVNITSLIYLTTKKISFKCRVRKARNASKKAIAKKRAQKAAAQSSFGAINLNEARGVSQIVEEMDEESSVFGPVYQEEKQHRPGNILLTQPDEQRFNNSFLTTQLKEVNNSGDLPVHLQLRIDEEPSFVDIELSELKSPVHRISHTRNQALLLSNQSTISIGQAMTRMDSSKVMSASPDIPILVLSPRVLSHSLVKYPSQRQLNTNSQLMNNKENNLFLTSQLQIEPDQDESYDEGCRSRGTATGRHTNIPLHVIPDTVEYFERSSDSSELSVNFGPNTSIVDKNSCNDNDMVTPTQIKGPTKSLFSRFKSSKVVPLNSPYSSETMERPSKISATATSEIVKFSQGTRNLSRNISSRGLTLPLSCGKVKDNSIFQITKGTIYDGAGIRQGSRLSTVAAPQNLTLLLPNRLGHKTTSIKSNKKGRCIQQQLFVPSALQAKTNKSKSIRLPKQPELNIQCQSKRLRDNPDLYYSEDSTDSVESKQSNSFTEETKFPNDIPVFLPDQTEEILQVLQLKDGPISVNQDKVLENVSEEDQQVFDEEQESQTMTARNEFKFQELSHISVVNQSPHLKQNIIVEESHQHQPDIVGGTDNNDLHHINDLTSKTGERIHIENVTVPSQINNDEAFHGIESMLSLSNEQVQGGNSCDSERGGGPILNQNFRQNTPEELRERGNDQREDGCTVSSFVGKPLYSPQNKDRTDDI